MSAPARAGRRRAGARAGRAAFLGGVVGLLLGLAAPALPAAAHAYLVDSDPAAEAVLPAPPERIVLTFSESVRLVPDGVRVLGPDSQRVDRDAPVVRGPVVTVPVPGDVPQGTYLVSYRVISADGHPVSGALTYSVGSPSAVPPASAGATADGDPLRGAVSAVRYVGYAGLVLLVGAAVALARLWPRRLSRTGAARLLWTGVGLVAVGTVAGVWLQVPYTTGGPVTDVSAAAVADVLATTYGRAHLVRLGVLAAAVWLLRRVTAGRATRGDLAVLAVLGAVGLGTWPVAGHPVTTPAPAVSVAVGTLHLAAAAFWLGGLVVLAGILLRRADDRELGAILPVWSVWAATAVAVLVVAGVVQAVLTVGTPGAVLSTRYGLLLTAKVALVAVVVAVAAYSRRTVRRLAASAPAGRPRGLRTAVALEAGLLAGVLVLSSVLVQTVPARTEMAAAEAAGTTDTTTSASGPFTATTHSTLYALDVTVDPAATGVNTVDLRVYTHTGEPLPVVEWRGTASLPAAGVDGVDIRLSAVGDNHARGEVNLPLAGEWELRLTVRISEIDQATVLVSAPVGPGG